MTSPQRFEQDLPALLEGLYLAGTPDYRDDLVRQVARVRQRPAWTFPERWLPMDFVTERVSTPRVPWRALGALALIALLIAAAVAAYVGSQARLPAPFGVARNGVVAYASDGDIHTVDPETGAVTAVVTGPETDLDPVFSLDGTHLVFQRKATGAGFSFQPRGSEASGSGLLYVVGSDGTELTRVTPEALQSIESYAFSPDGREILISATRDGGSTILFARSDGTDIRALTLPESMAGSEPEYRPPDGAELVFVGNTGGSATGLYAVEPDGEGLRPIVERSGFIFGMPRWSPDGSRLAFTSAGVDWATGGQLLRVNVVAADGEGAQVLGPHPRADLEGDPSWSGDGTRLLISRCLSTDGNVTDGFCDASYAVVPADRSGHGIDLVGPGLEAATSRWAPDDRSIVTSFGRLGSESILWDPLSGRSRSVPWTAPENLSWQRRAP